MTIKIQSEVYSVLIVTAVIAVAGIVLGRKIAKSDPSEKPKGAANFGLMIVNFFDGFVRQNMGDEYVGFLGPVVGTLGIYVLLANWSGLVSLPNPTQNFSVTVTLAFLAWLVIEGTQIHVKGWKGYFKGYLSPIAVFLPMNVISELSPILSISMRLFGNILVGGVLMGLVYSATSLLSGLIPGLNFNVFGPVFAPILHAYFDVFQGAIQMYVFITLTTCLAKSKSE